MSAAQAGIEEEAAELSRRHFLAGSIGATILASAPVRALAAPPEPFSSRELPARSLPVPDTVSPELQAVIATPYPSDWDVIPADAAGWRALAAKSASDVAPFLPPILEQLGVEISRDTIAGVPVFVLTPKNLPPANRDRLLVHFHGGGYVLYPGEAGAGEAMLMAGYGGFRVVSVDYRMAPDHPFPAALDDAIAVWRALIADHDPKRMAMFGTSSGGGLTLAAVLKARELGLPLPAAIAPGTPWADLTGAGDTLAANAFVDNVLVSPSGWVGAAAKLYAGSHDLRDPLVSPLFGDFQGLPPAIITSGTRDLFLSLAVRTHRKLRQAGVEAALQVFEGQSHAQFLYPFLPETEEAFAEIALFFDAHLAG